MTAKRRPTVLGLMVAANVESARSSMPEFVSEKPARSKSRATKPHSWTFVPVEDVLFAGMDEKASVREFDDAEIERIAKILGLSLGEVAELYRP